MSREAESKGAEFIRQSLGGAESGEGQDAEPRLVEEGDGVQRHSDQF
jgi:hypothetical protein